MGKAWPPGPPLQLQMHVPTGKPMAPGEAEYLNVHKSILERDIHETCVSVPLAEWVSLSLFIWPPGGKTPRQDT